MRTPFVLNNAPATFWISLDVIPEAICWQFALGYLDGMAIHLEATNRPHRSDSARTSTFV